MTTNRDRATKVLEPHAFVPSRAVDDLAAAGLLADDGSRTVYGVWSRSPSGAEDYHWCRDESLGTATDIYYNMQGAGWEAEIIARHVSEPRFVTRTAAAAHAETEVTDD